MIIALAMNVGCAVLFVGIWAYLVRRAYVLAGDSRAAPSPFGLERTQAEPALLAAHGLVSVGA